MPTGPTSTVSVTVARYTTETSQNTPNFEFFVYDKVDDMIEIAYFLVVKSLILSSRDTAVC